MSRAPAFAPVFFLLLTSTVVAQMPAKTARIEMVCPIRCVGPAYVAFDDELRRLGWEEGRNLTIERRALEGHYERVRDLAAEAVRSKPDIIVGPGAIIARALKEATSQIPIAFSFVANPVELGLVQSLAHPGANVTGIAAVTPGAVLAKQFQILRDVLPQAKRVAILTNPANPDYQLLLGRELPMALQFGWQIDVIEVRAPEEIPSAVAKAQQLGAEGLLVLGDAIMSNPPNRVPDLLAQAGLPAVYSVRNQVLAGGLVSYTPDMVAIVRRHAQYVDRILRGAAPAGMPVEQPADYTLTINLKTARALGLSVPSALLSGADEVIE